MVTYLPAILFVESDRPQLEAMVDLMAQVITGFEYVTAASADEGFKTLEKLINRQQEIALVLASQPLIDGKGDTFLQKAYERWPHSIRILMANGQEGLADEVLNAAKIYRVLRRPLDRQEFRYGLQEAVRQHLQRQELGEKSRILGELHRASMSLTGEINLQNLLHKLMRIVIDNADAENGYILLEDEQLGGLYIAAEGHQGSYETKLQSLQVNEQSPVAPVIVDSARKTRDNVILNDALNEGMFTSHPYVRKNLLRSVLCSPFVYQGKLFGLLYLDNRNKTSAFSPYSLELFRLLSAPAAIAIQNAQLYADLERKVVERTREVTEQKGEIEAQRDEIQAKNDDILGSIRYARRIQDAFLPRVHEVKEVFPNSFVYYKPKDIVSGDFYWFTQRLSKVILAAADCTGHGIPGAFMTIMANTLLRQIVELEGIFKPDEILNQLHLRVRMALQQEGGVEGNANRDGLDIALCQIDPKRNRLQFAGANRQLIIVRNHEIIEIKGDRMAIGGEQPEVERIFTNHHVDLEPGDTLYIFTDGYPDQIGEEINKRFLSRRFYQLLLEYQKNDMDHQRLLLDAELRHWRGDMEQTDDILVIGIRF